VEPAVLGALGVDRRSAGAAGLRPYGAADLHATLFFLGDVGDAAEAELESALGLFLEGAPAPSLRLAGTGAFPQPGRERVLWLGVEDLGGLADLHERVSAACAEAGFAPEERPFHPHVTVARVRRRRDGSFPRIGRRFYGLDLDLEWKPDEVALVRSLGGGGGDAYEVVSAFPLDPESGKLGA
jgi:2'-5' RNA ligase